MIKEAELHKKEDEERRNLVENRNHLESLILETEKNLNTTYKSFEGDPDYEAVKNAVTEARSAQTQHTENGAELKKALDRLRDISVKHMGNLYTKQAQRQGGSGGSDQQQQ